MSQDTRTPSNANHNDLAQQAQAQIDAGHYQEAITLYKKLLQGGDNNDYYRQIAHCYLQRAKSFAARGMVKEALVLWESYTRYAQPPYPDYDHYILWLIEAQDENQIQTSLRQLSGQQLDNDYPNLAAILGLLILARHPKLQQALADESNFCTHLKIVQTALQSPTLDGMLETLKSLPYRSAFRDIRLLARACQKASVSMTEASALLDKIPAHSPYSGPAHLLRNCNYDGAKLADQLISLNLPQRKLIGEINGLSIEQLKLLDALGDHYGLLNDKTRFDLAIRFQTLFGTETSQRFCLTLLNRYPAGGKDYRKSFGAIDEFENHRIKALNDEREHRFQDAEAHWHQCIDQLKNEGGDNDLKIALILRHMAEHQTELEQAAQLRIESLKDDPNDKNCLLEILKFYSQSEEAVDLYQTWLDKALLEYPQDREVLTLASETASRHKAYQQALEYADALLQIDPLNSAAKQILITAHRYRAREQLKYQNYQQAGQEIALAEALKGNKPSALKTQLLRALLLFTSEDQTLGLARFCETLEKMHADPVNKCFQACIEIELCGLKTDTFLQALPPVKDYLLSAQELKRLIQQIAQYIAECEQQELIAEAVDNIKTPLLKSLPELAEDEELLLTLCQGIEKLEYFELIQHCINCIEEYWEKPIWVYYQIYIDTQGDPSRCDNQQENLLTINLDKAKSANDRRARVLIEQYLDRYHDTESSATIEHFQSADPVEQLFAHVPDKTLSQIDQLTDTLFQEVSPEQLAADLAPSVANNKNLLVSIMNDPNLFTALMTLRAADELNIDLGVDIEEVLNFFKADKPARRSFPFPF